MHKNMKNEDKNYSFKGGGRETYYIGTFLMQSTEKIKVFEDVCLATLHSSPTPQISFTYYI